MMNDFIDKFYQELKGENEEVLNRLVHSYKDEISKIIWKNTQKWCKWDDAERLTPNNTRFYYRKNKTEIVVQEFAPQTRLLKIDKTIYPYGASISSEEYKSYSIALPYTVFIFKFVDGMFDSLYCTFLESPIKKFEDEPVLPYLPNIQDFEVCLGFNFKHTNLIKEDLTQQCAYVLDFFWNSVFTQEHTTYCQIYHEHFTRINDSRMVSWEAWEEASVKDPFFVIDDVQWKKSEFYNFGDLISFALKNAGDDELKQSVFDEISEEILEDIKKIILNNVEKVRERMVTK